MDSFELPPKRSNTDDRFAELPPGDPNQHRQPGAQGDFRYGDPNSPTAAGEYDSEWTPNIRLPDENRGVAGWLLFFCIVLTILSPIATVVTLATGIKQALPIMVEFPGLRNLMIIDSVLSVLLMAFSIYAGTGLWNVRPGAVRTAKTYLLTFLAYQALASFLPFTAGLPKEANAAMMKQVTSDAIRSMIFFGVWFSFLSVSKRVKATYES